MCTINDRIQIIVNEIFSGNKAAFAKALELAPTSISNYLGKQRTSKPSVEIAEKIVDRLNIDANWLLTGKGEMMRGTSGNSSINDKNYIELLNLCKLLVANYQQRDNIIEKLVLMAGKDGE